jgi:hypothetical protein
MASDFAASSFVETVFAAQNAIDGPSELNAGSLVKLLMQVKT